MNPVKILVIPGSCRSGSHNVRLAAVVTKELSLQGADATRISLEDYPLPIYNGDEEAKNGVPENALKLARLMAEQDGVVFVSPEYNASLTPLMKNTIDWMSVISKDGGKPLQAYKGRIFAMASASPGGLGGIRALNHLRAVLLNVGAQMISEQVAVGHAATAFDDDDKLKDERAAQLLVEMCQSLLHHARWYARR